MTRFKVITLCGSTRFKDAFIREQKRLTLAGNIVISVGLFGHSGDDEVWEGMNEDTITKTKMMLDDMHKQKIDMADEIFVINENGYIGASTESEINYAESKGKTVNYLMPVGVLGVERKEFLNSGKIAMITKDKAIIVKYPLRSAEGIEIMKRDAYEKIRMNLLMKGE